MNTQEKIAEILAGCGYAQVIHEGKLIRDVHDVVGVGSLNKTEHINPYGDTIEGRRQADALEDWLSDKHMRLFIGQSAGHVPPNSNYHQWRLDRIKWCISELVK